jgi:asparagine synthase (glutamine-hydrolysing)
VCGIAGIVTRDRQRVHPDVLERMGTAMRHRGPDDSGTWIGESGPWCAGLAHRRLSIIDLTSAGHQPMANEDGTIQLTYNGEVYNHAGLRQELEAAGHRYTSHTDSETIIHAYEEWGESFMDRFRGMFAFGIWDSGRRRLTLVRDRLGIKPLYYARVGDSLVFASEIKAILSSGLISPEADRAALPEYLQFGYLSDDRTMFRHVRALPPGHVLTWDESGCVVRPYWTLRFEPRVRPEPELWRDFAGRFDEAVRLRLMSDVPLGVFLSGGLDSSAIAAVMQQHMSGVLKTFSVGFPDGYYSELPYARIVARHLHAEHHEVVLTAADFLASLPQMVWHEDEPIWTIASVAMYHVSKLAAGHVKVVLSGEGSDELFAGYDRYWFGSVNERFGSAYARVPRRLRAAVRHLLNQGAVPERARRALSHTFLTREANVEAIVLDNWFGIFTPAMQRELCSPEWLDALNTADVYAHHRTHFNQAGSDDIVDRMLYMDIKTNLVELLMKQDRMSMATSIESRVPFLDHHLVEFAATIPSAAKLGAMSGKRMIKEAVRHLLPNQIIDRRKQGFPVPFDRWLQKDFFPEIEALLLSDRALSRGWFRPEQVVSLLEAHRRQHANLNRQIWALLNLELWARIFLDQERTWVEAPREAWAELRRNPASAVA